jgi:signal peptidase II
MTVPRARHRRWIEFGVLVGIGVALDALTKYWALARLEPGFTVHALGGALPLTLSFNPGIAFGLHLGAASRYVFTALTVVVLGAAVLLYGATPLHRRSQRAALCLMCAGAIGNLLDRVARSRGVVDFIGPYDLRFMVWPIFNVADCWVVVGTAWLALALWWGGREKHPHGAAVRPADSVPPARASDPSH